MSFISFNFSWFNKKEIDTVIYYVNLLLIGGIKGKRISEADIGIISPYKRQVRLMCLDILTHFDGNLCFSVRRLKWNSKDATLM